MMKGEEWHDRASVETHHFFLGILQVEQMPQEGGLLLQSLSIQTDFPDTAPPCEQFRDTGDTPLAGGD